MRKALVILQAIIFAPLMIPVLGIYGVVLGTWSKLDDIDCAREIARLKQ